LGEKAIPLITSSPEASFELSYRLMQGFGIVGSAMASRLSTGLGKVTNEKYTMRVNGKDYTPKHGSQTAYEDSSNTAQGLLKKNGIPSTLTDEEIAAANKVDLQMSLKKIDDKFLKKQGIDAHELKTDFVGNKNISKYDLYVETDTGEIFIYQKGAKGEGIATGEYIKK